MSTKQVQEQAEPSPAVRKWLSAIGKKGGPIGRATPPKNRDGSPGHWKVPEEQKH